MRRRQRRLISQFTSIFILFAIVISMVYPTSKFISSWQVKNEKHRIAAAQKEQLIIEEKKSEPVVQTAVSQLKGTVLAGGLNGTPFWKVMGIDYYDDTCVGRGRLFNNCEINKSKTVLFDEILFMKTHRGVQFDGGGVDAWEKVEKTHLEWDYVKQKYVKVVDDEKIFEYCDASGDKGELESYAAINLGPFSLPPFIVGQEISTMRAFGESELDAEYAELDAKYFRELTKPGNVDKILDFCDSDNEKKQDALRTYMTYRGYTSASNISVSGADAIDAFCKLIPAADREEKFKEYVLEADQGKDRVALRVDIEYNGQGLSRGFEDEVMDAGIHGVISSGVQYHGMWAWQTKESSQARMNNIAWAGEFLTNQFLPPTLTVDALVESGEYGENNIISPAPAKRQWENDKATLVDAILGGVYFISEDAIRDDNLAMVSFDEGGLDSDRYWCDEDPGRCPMVRMKTGCANDKEVKTDIRLRSIAVADNDLRRYSAVQDDYPRVANRSDYFVNNVTAPPTYSIYEKASINEIAVTSGHATGACKDYAQDALDLLPDDSKLSEAELELLGDRFEADKDNYVTNAILVSPVRLKYDAWALYYVDHSVINECQNWGDGGCYGIDTDNNNREVKKIDGERVIPALISFNIATAMRALKVLPANDIRVINYQDDFEAAMEDFDIYPMAGVKIDCGDQIDGAGVVIGPDYWLCSSSNSLLPKCQ